MSELFNQALVSMGYKARVISVRMRVEAVEGKS